MKQVAVTLLFIFSLAAAADTLKGVVQNSTTNKPSSGDEVTLKKIGNGMEDVAKTKTNARGYRVERAGTGHVCVLIEPQPTWSGRSYRR